jgi:2-polyprenyl-6-methoxyphenol hydroxylase-like FAD-dependent oxidoreductase
MRKVEPEWLDQLPASDPRAQGSRRDLRRLNAWMGSAPILMRVLREVCASGRPGRLIELGAGDGQLLLKISRRLAPAWPGLHVVTVDRQHLVSGATRAALAVRGWKPELIASDAFEWLRGQVAAERDVIFANLFLHHFAERQLQELLALAAARAAAFIALEPRRGVPGLVFSRLVGLIGCNGITQHDAPTSVRAGFSGSELTRLWPEPARWQIRESRAGFFGHLFVAQRRIAHKDSNLAELSEQKPLSLVAEVPGSAGVPNDFTLPRTKAKVRAPRSVTIVGGGLAGLTLGIGLRRADIPVILWEAGQYPRHRVCGEFISGQGQGVLARLGLEEPILRAGARFAHSAAFFLGPYCSSARPLAQPALCISRYHLDAALADLFVRAGGELRAGVRWRADANQEGVVNACGRRATPVENGWRWLGLKVHAEGVALAADLEMHCRADGYVGLCRLDEEKVNVCGLFRRRPGQGERGFSSRELLAGPPGTVLADRLGSAQFLEHSLRSVAGLGLRPQRGANREDCCVGDALTMIPPVTGNGMSMAFEAAELAIKPVAAWSRGELSWAEARDGIARGCDEQFAQRLAWARLLQWFMFSPLGWSPFGRLAFGSDWLWKQFFERTR